MFNVIERVSIHAPARGATVFDEGRSLAHSGFNPRAREGRDDKLLVVL